MAVTTKKTKHPVAGAEESTVLVDGIALAKERGQADVGPIADGFLAGWHVADAKMRMLATRPP